MKNLQLEKSTVEVFAAGRLVESFKSEKELLSIAPARICEWAAMSQKYADDAVQLALNTGALLLEVKARLPHGAFLLWLAQNCSSVSKSTAYNYMSLAEGAQENYMKLAGGADDDGEIIEGEATVSDDPAPSAPLVDERSLTQLYIGFGIVRRPPKWGGDRSEKAAENGHVVGRRPKNLAKEVEAAAADPDLSWAEVKDYLNDLIEFGIEKDGFGNLTDDDLETVVINLAKLSRRAGDILAARKKGTSAIKQANTPVEEAVDVLERGL